MDCQFCGGIYSQEGKAVYFTFDTQLICWFCLGGILKSAAALGFEHPHWLRTIELVKQRE